MQEVMQYLRAKRYICGTAIFFLFIFLITFYLYRLPVSAVLYPAFICAVFLIPVFVIDFRSVKKRAGLIKKYCNMPAEMITDFPESYTLSEESYKELVLKLKGDISKLKEESMAAHDDMVDYYTTWAHQIKTPISSMKLSLQNEDSELERRLVGDLFRLEQYTDMVLAFIRLGSDSNDFVIKEYDLDKILRSSVRKFASEFIGRKLSLSYNPVNIKAVTDEKWIAFVFEQILSNALKYTKKGSISIYEKNGKQLCISDTGIGIRKEDLPRIFEKGYTGYNGRTNRASSGLGLYLCKRICKKLGIEIGIESELSQGTVVSLYFDDTRVERSRF